MLPPSRIITPAGILGLLLVDVWPAEFRVSILMHRHCIACNKSVFTGDMAPVIGGLTLPVEHCLVRLVPVVYREPNGPLFGSFSKAMVCVKVAGII